MPNKRSRQQAQKSSRPSVVTGKRVMQSADTLAFMDAYGRLGGRQPAKRVNHKWDGKWEA